MRSAFVLLPLLLCACSTVAAPPPVHGVTPGHTCRPDGADQFIGRTASEEVGAAILHVSNAAVLRWAPPGVMLTMDYRFDRVTVSLDAANTITQVKCG